jgi:two-component system, sensor histidine kinase and response regulator
VREGSGWGGGAHLSLTGRVDARPGGEDVRILLVDDRDDNLEVLAALLEEPGVELLRASSGTAALELLLVHEVALALLDVHMPDMDGFELAELMRGAERTSRVPIIFVTAARPEPVRLFRGYEAGAVDFLYKPIDAQLLRSKVAVFIELFRQRQLLAAQVDEHKELLATAELLIAVLSHDLRAPLGAIRTAGQLLTRLCPGNDDVGFVAQRIDSSSRRMARLITQLLDFTTARMGRLPIRAQDVDLDELSDTAVSDFREISGRLQREVIGDSRGTWDPDRLLQVLSNLIGNAVQHGVPDTPITVRIDGSDAHTVLIVVENIGAIPKEMQDELFSPFVRSEGAATGTGLGLYIVDQIARTHGGDALAHSRDERTVFTVRLPRHLPDPVDQ